MNQETRSLLAIGLSVAVFLIWYSYFAPKPPQKAVTSNQSSVVSGQQADGQKEVVSGQPSAVGKTIEPSGHRTIEPNDPQSSIPIKTTIIESDLYRVTLSNDGGVPISWQMKKFPKGNGSTGTFVELVNADDPPLLISDMANNLGLPERPRFKIVGESANSVTYIWKSEKLQVLKEFSFSPDDYFMDVNVSVMDHGFKGTTPQISLGWTALQPKVEKRGFLGFLKGPQDSLLPVYYLDGKVSREAAAEKEGKLYWAGIETRYFFSAIIPRDGDTAKLVVKTTAGEDGSRALLASVSTPALVSDYSASFHYSVYAGPKEINQLQVKGPDLEKAINYGWFTFVAVPILHLLKFFYKLIHNYGVAIILLTIFVKLLLHPLSRHSMKSMKAMQLLQPKLKELREKYKNDKERLNMETMQLFKSNKVNPMGGCLPMVLQLPIYIALYKVLWNSIELYHAPFFWFYRDLSAPDPYFITPVLLGVFMWLQQKMTPSASADPAQAKMMQIMPIMFTAFMLFLPSGLVVYILVNTAMGVLQQWMTNHDIRLRDLLRGRLPQRA